MDAQLTPKQVLVLWRLLFLGDRPLQSQVKPALSPVERGAMVRDGLVALVRRARGAGKELHPTDEAWEWAREHLDAPVSNSAAAADVLLAVLAQVKRQLDSGVLTLPDLVRGPRAAGGGAEERVLAACRDLAGGGDGPVRICDLRRGLPGLPAGDLDAALLALRRARRLHLSALSDPTLRTPEVEAAAVEVLGERYHVAYLEG